MTVLDTVKRAVYFTQQNRGTQTNLSKKAGRLLLKLSFFYVPTKNEFEAHKRINCCRGITKKAEFEMELVKNVDCIPYGYGFYSSS